MLHNAYDLQKPRAELVKILENVKRAYAEEKNLVYREAYIKPDIDELEKRLADPELK